MHHRPQTRLASLALAVVTASAATSSAFAQTEPAAPIRQGQREDDERTDRPLTVPIGPYPVELTGRWSYTDEHRRNFDTETPRRRDRRVREHEVKLDARAHVTPSIEVMLQAVGLHESRRTQGTPGKIVSHELGRGQAWVRFDRLGGSPWSLQVGRIALVDRRGWWWDEDLDAVRVQLGDGPFELDAAFARELGRRTSAEDSLPGDERGVTRRLVRASWLPARRHRVDLFGYDERDGSGSPAEGAVVAREHDLDESDRRARWFGARASGEWRFDPIARLTYWVDAARVRGRERTTAFDEDDDGRFTVGATDERPLRGGAWDVGVGVSAPQVPLRPFVTLSQARGSRDFRQTGLQENKSRRGGVKRWQTYGELLQPELSNLSVRTVGAGVRVLGGSSVEVYAHRYRQLEASGTLRGSRLSSDPTGDNRDIGREIDVLVAMREWRSVEGFVSWSRFTPGRAFAEGERDHATSFEVGVQINF